MAKTTPKSMKGALKKYANPDLIGQERNAWEMAAVEKYDRSCKYRK